HQTRSCTEGVDVFARPHPSGRGRLVFLDVEGQGSTDRNDTYDAALTTVAMLLSSMVVYNCLSVGLSGDVNKLELLSGFMQNIVDRTFEEHGEREAAGSDRFCPALMWLLRDFFLEMVDANERPCDADTYLEEVLLAPVSGSSRANKDKNRKLNDIKQVLQKRCLRTLPRPIAGDDFRDLQECGLQSPPLLPEFVQKAEKLLSEVNNLPIPKQHNGRCVSGAMLAALTEELVSSIDAKGVPELLTSWQQVCKQETLRAFQQAVMAYDAEWSTGPLPIDDASESHKKALGKSLQVYRSIVLGSGCIDELMQELDRKLESWLAANDAAAEALCSRCLKEQLRTVMQAQEAGDYCVPGGLALYDRATAAALTEFRGSPEARRFPVLAGACVADWVKTHGPARAAICKADDALHQAAKEAEFQCQRQALSELEHAASMEALQKQKILNAKRMEVAKAAHEAEVNRLRGESEALRREHEHLAEKRRQELQLMLQQGRKAEAESFQQTMAFAQEAQATQLRGIQEAMRQSQLHQQGLQRNMSESLRAIAAHQEHVDAAARRAAEIANQEASSPAGLLLPIANFAMSFFPSAAPMIGAAASALTGAFHSACSHAVCDPCLRQLVLSQLPKSREQWQLEILCPEPLCQKRVPQRLVAKVKEADELAKAIDTDGLWPSLGAEVSQRCPLCRKEAAVHVNRVCGHAACESCWLDGLEEKLRWCRENAAMDIPCPHPGCHEGCYDVLRHFESPFLEELELYVREAKVQLVEFSSFAVHGPPGAPGPVCPVCERQSMAVLHCPCGLAACSSCWKGFVQEQLARCKEDFKLSPLGWYPWRAGCSCQENLLAVLPPSLTQGFQEQRALVKTQQQELKRLFPYAVPRNLRAGPPPACVVCGEDAMVLLHPPCCPKDHAACQTCWARWGEERGESNLHEEDWLCPGYSFTGRYVLQEFQAVAAWLYDGSGRWYVNSDLGKSGLNSVDCPQPGCVGLGYLGFDTVMCFICEHQWDATEGILGEETELPEGEEVTEAAVAGVKVKRCPKCHEYIEKNG
ncbi:GBP3, partial [Symbiodinium microadriaticum]